MNNQYKHSGQPLTPHIAQKLIQELFSGQTVRRREIVNTVFEQHHERGGTDSEVRPNIIQSALKNMKESGLAANPEHGVWYIIDYITTLNEFMEWAAQFDSGEDSKQYLFRGVSSADYRIDASAYRRIKRGRNNNEEQDGDFEKFLQINKDLIRDARFRGHDRKDGRKLEDLEVLAEFQHYGAATFLMDFTYNALVALWFACKENSRHGPKDGKVVAVPPNDPKYIGQTGEFSVIILESLEKKIDQLSLDNKRLYQWQPRQQQNERIIAQQSIFLFGILEIDINPDEECIIDRNSKENIRDSLRRIYGITEDALFPDFDGFARQHSQDVPYTQLSSSQYHQRAYEAHRRGEYEAAMPDYDAAIRINPNEVDVYYNRGTARFHLGRYEDAITDFDETVNLNRDYASAYNNRGLAKERLGRYEDAIADFDEAIRINPDEASFYYHRGLANNSPQKYEDVIADFSQAIRLAPDNALFRFHRGLTKFYLGEREAATAATVSYDEAHRDPYYALKQYLEHYESAISDFDEVIHINPDYTQAYYQRGLSKHHLEEYESAISDFDVFINRNPDYKAFYYRAEANSHLDLLTEASMDLQRALPIAQEAGDEEFEGKIEELLYYISSRTVGESEDE